MARILIVDADPLFVEGLTENIRALYPLLRVETTGDARAAEQILQGERVDLLLIDLELPAPPGVDLLASALASGMDKNRIVILSARDPEYLHERFPMGSCLAVMNKFEAKQQACLDMILSSMQRKAAALNRSPVQGGEGEDRGLRRVAGVQREEGVAAAAGEGPGLRKRMPPSRVTAGRWVWP